MANPSEPGPNGSSGVVTNGGFYGGGSMRPPRRNRRVVSAGHRLMNSLTVGEAVLSHRAIHPASWKLPHRLINSHWSRRSFHHRGSRHGTWTINVPRLPLGRCYRPYRNPALLPYRKGQYNADFYVGGAMANTFPMMRKGAAGHAIKPTVGYVT